MTLPKFADITLPLLRLVGDGGEHRARDLIVPIEDHFALTDEERDATIPSGKQTVVYNRLTWAGTYLVNAGLLERPKRGHLRITERGREVLASSPSRIDVEFLSQYEEFRAFKSISSGSKSETDASDDAGSGDELTPQERVERGIAEMHAALKDKLLKTVREQSWEFFEQLVVDVLVAMGYGSLREAGATVTRKSGDEGIDGIIDQDRLGLDKVYVQAKRWQGTVGRPTVQAFAGSLEGARASKGVMITTSEYAHTAREYVNMIQKRIVLVDGARLAELMVEHGVGVSTEAEYRVHRIDTDYFEIDP